MNKEAQEKIKEAGMYFSDRCQFCHDFGEKVEPYLCPRCVEGILKLGYRKLPKDKPPLVDNPYIYESEECNQYMAFAKGKRTQREADIKHYEGGQL